MRRLAFTLIELLVVIAIIAILAAILFPVFGQARENARKSACLSNMRQISSAIMMYTEDYNETFPLNRFGWPRVPYTWREAVLPYIKNLDLFRDPSNPNARRLYAPSKVPGVDTSCWGSPQVPKSYTYNGNFFNRDDQPIPYRRAGEIVRPSELLLLIDASSIGCPDTQMHCLSRNISKEADCFYFMHRCANNWGYADGHVKWLKAEFTLTPYNQWLDRPTNSDDAIAIAGVQSLMKQRRCGE
jgi:prepilin-type N-terminal cleavage/methylation domain-containing protein